MAYTNRLAIIAGGLGGLGTSIAKLLHSNSAHLTLLYAPFESSRRDQVLTTVFGSPNPKNITPLECDITSESSVSEAFTKISKHASSQGVYPSILVNAAGYVTVAPLSETSVEEATKNILPNLLGPFIVGKAFHRLYTGFEESSWESRGGKGGGKPPGRIVSISSQAAHVALDGHGPYCASKAGLNALTRVMALEWGPDGITSNTVSPTVVLTELGKRAWSDPEKRAKMESMIPTGRFAVPEEIAGAVEYLCRDEAGMTNGADIRIDGGFTIR